MAMAILRGNLARDLHTKIKAGLRFSGREPAERAAR